MFRSDDVIILVAEFECNVQTLFSTVSFSSVTSHYRFSQDDFEKRLKPKLDKFSVSIATVPCSNRGKLFIVIRKPEIRQFFDCGILKIGSDFNLKKYQFYYRFRPKSWLLIHQLNIKKLVYRQGQRRFKGQNSNSPNID